MFAWPFNFWTLNGGGVVGPSLGAIVEELDGASYKFSSSNKNS